MRSSTSSLRRVAVGAVALLLPLTAAACGSSDDDSSSKGDESTEQTTTTDEGTETGETGGVTREDLVKRLEEEDNLDREEAECTADAYLDSGVDLEKLEKVLDMPATGGDVDLGELGFSDEDAAKIGQALQKSFECVGLEVTPDS